MNRTAAMPRLPALLLLLFTALTARAETIQSLAAIDTAVHDFVAAAIDGDSEFTQGRLDPRLRLAPCTTPLALRFSREPRGGPNAVEVRCTGAQPWSLYVTVDIARYAEVVVATRALTRGTIIQAGDVALARRRVSGTRMDYLSDVASAVGRVAARIVPADTILGAGNVMLPLLVKRGDEVVLASVGGAISVKVKATALKNGALGERVTVRNLGSKRVVEGTVGGDGLVVVQSGAVL